MVLAIDKEDTEEAEKPHSLWSVDKPIGLDTVLTRGIAGRNSNSNITADSVRQSRTGHIAWVG